MCLLRCTNELFLHTHIRRLCCSQSGTVICTAVCIPNFRSQVNKTQPIRWAHKTIYYNEIISLFLRPSFDIARLKLPKNSERLRARAKADRAQKPIALGSYSNDEKQQIGCTLDIWPLVKLCAEIPNKSIRLIRATGWNESRRIVWGRAMFDSHTPAAAAASETRDNNSYGKKERPDKKRHGQIREILSKRRL